MKTQLSNSTLRVIAGAVMAAVAGGRGGAAILWFAGRTVVGMRGRHHDDWRICFGHAPQSRQIKRK